MITLRVKAAWYLKGRNWIVVTLLDNSMHMFNITPFRPITKDDLQEYTGVRPRAKSYNTHWLPYYLYRFYGLEKVIPEVKKQISIGRRIIRKRKKLL